METSIGLKDDEDGVLGVGEDFDIGKLAVGVGDELGKVFDVEKSAEPLGYIEDDVDMEELSAYVGMVFDVVLDVGDGEDVVLGSGDGSDVLDVERSPVQDTVTSSLCPQL